MSLGRYLDLSINPVERIRTFMTAADAREQDGIELLSQVGEENNSFVVIKDSDVQGLQRSDSTSSANRHPLNLSAVQIQFLRDKPAAVTNILRKLKTNGFICKFDLEARKVEIKPTEDKTAEEALQIIRESVVELEFPAVGMDMMEDTVDFIPSQEPDEVQALVVKSGSIVKLVGLSSDLVKIGGSLRNSMKNLGAVIDRAARAEKTKIIPLTEHCFQYLHRYKQVQLHDIVKNFPNVRLEQERKKFKLQGPSTAVNEAAERVQELVNQVRTYPVILGPQMNVAVVAQAAEEIGNSYECSMTFQQNFGAMGGAPFQLPILQDPNFPSLSLSVLELKETRIRIVMNAIEKQKAHVIVNTTNHSLDLNKGKGVSWCISQTAGPTVQEELKLKFENGITNGEVAESGPGNINTCKTIYHGALPQFPKNKSSPNYQEAEDNCFKWIVSLVFNCLIKASSSEKGYRTIAFPALGTGMLEYPALHVVQLMYKAIKLFNDDKRSGQIRDIILVIHPETKLAVKQMFLAHRQTYKMNTYHVSRVAKIHEENKREENVRKCEVRAEVGNILLQVVNGKIPDSCEVSEAVLVLWTAHDIENPKLNPELVCTDRLKKDWNCSSYVSELDETTVAADTTTLPRRTLIHVSCKDNSEQTIVEAIVTGMKEAANLKCLTMTIPIAAEGQLAKKPRTSAGMVIKALKKSQVEIYVVTVAIEDSGTFVNFCTKVENTLKFLEPADTDKSPVAVRQWKKTFAQRASESHSSLQAVMTMTNQNSVLLITSDSDQKNETAANEIKQKLAAHLAAVIQ